MKQEFTAAKIALCSVFALSLFVTEVALAQGNSNNAKARNASVNSILDTTTAKCHPKKDACGAVSPRRKELLVGLCDMFQRRGNTEMKADLNKRLKGKTCQQAFADVNTTK